MEDYFFEEYPENIDYLNSILNDRLIREQNERENEFELETETEMDFE